MIYRDFFRRPTFIFLVSSLRGELHVFCGTWLRCNSLEWGALKRRPRDPAKRGSGSAGDGRDHALKVRSGACIPLRGRIFLWKALLRPSRSHHSASLRLALHPKNHTLRPVQLPDLGSKQRVLFRLDQYFNGRRMAEKRCRARGKPISAGLKNDNQIPGVRMTHFHLIREEVQGRA